LLEQSDVCKPLLGYIAHDRSQRLVSARELPQPLDIAVPFYEDGERAPNREVRCTQSLSNSTKNSMWKA
jgi:hypothetical protein